MFDDDDLTWGDVARASEAKEPRFDTIARASSSGLPESKELWGRLFPSLKMRL